MTQNEKYLKKLKDGFIPILCDKELKNFELWSCEEYYIDDDRINFYIPITFDTLKTFCLDVANSDDYINVYIDWYTESIFRPEKIEMHLYYSNNSGKLGDFTFEVKLSVEQHEFFKNRLVNLCKKVYGKYPQDVFDESYL